MDFPRCITDVAFQSIIAICCFIYVTSSVHSRGENSHPGSEIPESEMFLPTLTVTAERRERDLQDTPRAVSAYDTDILTFMNVGVLPDLALSTPGLTIGNNNNTSTPEIYIRGVGTNNLSIGSDLSIGYYIDDVYVGRGKGMFLELFDVDRIEILRGPQGTLYGRNTIGGAIKVITKKPSLNFEAVQQLKIGNYDLVNVNGAVNAPLLHDRIYTRFAYWYQDRDGYSENVFSDRDLADSDSWSARGSLLFLSPADHEFLLQLDYTRDRPAGISYKPVFVDISGFPGHTEPSDPFKVNHDTDSRENRDIFGISGKYTSELDELSLDAISAFRKLDFDVLDDVDAVSLQLLDFSRRVEQTQFSQEFQLSNIEKTHIDWVAGIFVILEQIDDRSSIISSIIGRTTNFSEVDSHSFAIFGDVTYPLTDRLSLTGGARYTIDKKEFELERVNISPSGVMTTVLPKDRDGDLWQAVTPKLGLQYRLSEQILVYSVVSKGFKSGGYNSFQLESEFQTSFDPEFVTAYEAGAKSSWFDDRLRINIDGFYYRHQDMQVQTLIPSGTGHPQLVTTNAAKATEQGAEIEFIGILVEGLEVSGYLALLSTEYKDFIDEHGVDVSGNNLVRAPKLSTQLAIQYTIPLARFGRLRVRGERQFQSRVFFTESNEDVLSQRAFENFNARIEYENPSKRFTIAFYGRNLTDEESLNVAADLRDFLGTVDYGFSPPRTYGIELTCRF